MKIKFLITVALMLLTFCSCRAETDVTVLPEPFVPCETTVQEERLTVLINKNSRKYHMDLSCVYAQRMAEENGLLIEVPDREYLSEHNYEPCKKCSGSVFYENIEQNK